MACALSIETYKRQYRITSVVLRKRYREDCDRGSWMDFVIFSKGELQDYYQRQREKLSFARQTFKEIITEEERYTNCDEAMVGSGNWSEIHNSYCEGNWLDKFNKTKAQISVLLQEIAYCRETLEIKD